MEQEILGLKADGKTKRAIAKHAWANACNAIPKSLLGKAVCYAQSQRKYLERYLRDGRLEISYNHTERSIKPFVIGRKNFLVVNTPRGAKVSAILYSMVETAKENGLDPYKYLVLLFQTLPNCPKEHWVDFLPGGCGVPDSCPKPKQLCYRKDEAGATRNGFIVKPL